LGDGGLGIGPHPQSPIPNPQSPIPILISKKEYLNKILNKIQISKKLIIKLFI
jgi:hypothetical protein